MKEIALPVLGRQYNAQVLIAFKVEYINVYLLFSSLVYFFLFVQCCFSEVVVFRGRKSPCFRGLSNYLLNGDAAIHLNNMCIILRTSLVSDKLAQIIIFFFPKLPGAIGTP